MIGRRAFPPTLGGGGGEHLGTGCTSDSFSLSICFPVLVYVKVLSRSITSILYVKISGVLKMIRKQLWREASIAKACKF